MDLVEFVYTLSNFFVLTSQYFEKVFVYDFVILCCFGFVAFAFICRIYSISCCCHWKVMDPWNVCMHVYMNGSQALVDCC